MKIFIDTASVDEIKRINATGLLDGVTTNPTLIMRSGRNPEDVYQDLVDMKIPDISMEVVGTVGEMYNEGVRLAEKFGEQATIKVPCTPDGLMVCKSLSDKGIRVNVTLIFSVAQALLSAKAGAAYVSPFVGRCNDNSFSGVELVRAISGAFSVQRLNTEVLAASLRDVHHVSRCYLYGASTVTMPPKVFDKMYDHVLTREGLDLFQQDYEKTLSTLDL